MAITRSELERQIVHAGFGLVALSLRWLSWPVAAGIALVAVVHNLLLLPRTPWGAVLFREGEARLGGIALYPIVVLALILALPMHLAAGAWVILALGDSASNVCGRTLGRRKLPWNRAKSWAGLLGFALFAAPAAWGTMRFVAAGHGLASGSMDLLFAAAISSALAALVESLPLRVDDNLSVGFAAGAALFVLAHVS